MPFLQFAQKIQISREKNENFEQKNENFQQKISKKKIKNFQEKTIAYFLQKNREIHNCAFTLKRIHLRARLGISAYFLNIFLKNLTTCQHHGKK